MATNTFIIITVVSLATALAVAATSSTPSAFTERLLAGGSDVIRPRAQLTCDVYPRVCRAAGSPGPDCCVKDCVDVARDETNCGQCGMRCAYGEKCCGGSCVNVQFDSRNCGWCRNRCRRGGQCKYGMCDYA